MATKPPVEVPQGAIRLNTDFQKLEFFAQDQWWEMATDPTAPLGGGRGVFQGGGTGSEANVMDYVTIATAGNATDFGDTSDTQYEGGATSSRTRGIIYLGYSNPADSNIIEYITISSTGNATNFGDTATTGRATCWHSNGTRGVVMGWYTPGGYTNTIEYVTIASTGDAKDFGDCNFIGNYGAANVASPTIGIRAGFNPNGGANFVVNMDYVYTASTGNAFDWGDLPIKTQFMAGASNSTRGLLAGGQTPTTISTIRNLTFTTHGNIEDFGNLTTARLAAAGVASPTRAVFGGGGHPGVDVIDYVEIATGGTATDFGNLSVARANVAGMSNAHGGL